MNRFDEATSCFTRVIELSPDNAAAHYNLAGTYARQRRLPEAVQSCRQALRLKPDDLDARRTLGIVRLDLGQIDEAKAELSEVLRREPNDLSAMYHFGFALEKQGRPDLAVVQYDRVLRKNPNQVEALLGLGSIRAMASSPELRNGEEAVRLARRACALTGNRDLLAWDVLAAAFAEAGQFGEAVHTARAAMSAARAAGADEFVKLFQQRLRLYEQNRPFPVEDKPREPNRR